MSETNPKVQFQTTKGNIVIQLDAEKAPKTVENFLAYVKSGHYDGTIFHRVIPSFMIQGGGFDVDMKQKTTNATIQNEANNGLKNIKGSISMARTSAPHSATAQFFINVVDNAMLDFTSESPQGWGYAVFGQVTEGLDVVLTIEEVATGNHGGHQNVPLEPIVIEKVTLLEQ
ncbi:MAG: peptidylprolyl isomerase [Gammaproteobacteria bacterium]|nr:peptidylprolyl isomerase [Gammaproteobacteria bacterium]